MGLKCKISYSTTGQAVVTDSTGNISQLYTDALALTQNQDAALNIWASAFTPEFEQTFGKVVEGTEPPVLQVIKFYQSLKQLDGRLTTSEVFEAKQMMRSAGIRSLSDLSATLKDIFLYGDIPTVDTQRAIESGLFLPEDLPNIDLPKVVDFITRLEGETLYNDFEVEPENSQIKYRNTANKNVLGASEFVTIEQIDAEIIDLIDDFQSEDEFYGKIQELPYTDFVARFYEDTAFAQDFMSRFNDMAKVPVGEEVNGEIVVENVTTTAKTVKNTILDGLDDLDINADISFINSIADNVWDSNVEAVTEVVKEIESELATKNIDIIGLHRITTDKATLVEILDAVATMVANPTVQNIDNFAAIYDKTFLKQPAKKVVKVPAALQGLSLVSLTSPKTDQQLFEEHGLIKVGDNLYHKISLEADISDAYEYLYQQMQDGNFEIPYQYRTETNLDNKTGVLQDIAEYVNGRDTGLGYYNETASLYQLVFNHPKIDTTKVVDDTTSALNTIRTDEVYLKTDFVSDFYGMILQEKIKDSALYRNTLSKIGVTDNDLTITSDLIGDLTNIPMYQEFMDYMKLRKSADMKKYLPSTMYGDTNQALAAYNFPQTIEQYTGPTAEVENVLVTAPITEDFIRVGDNVYQKVKNSETASVFLRLKNNTNPTYYTTQPAFANFTQELIDRAATTDMVSNSKLTATDVANRKEKSGILSRIVTRIKARNKQVADPANQRNTQAFENNLIEFLRQKGVPVVTDAVAIRSALQQLGIDNVNQMFEFSKMKIETTAAITVTGNRVIVTAKPGTSISTPQSAYSTATRLYEKINKYLRENAGDFYRPNMVMRSGNTIVTNIPADLEQRVQELKDFYKEVDRIVEQQKQESKIPEPDRAAEELQRGVSPDVLKDLGYNMLETPVGNILGFEYQGTIYLDPANISNITTLHELIHVFQKMTNIKAEAGDEMAQKILQKKENVFGDMAREWEVFHQLTTDPQTVFAQFQDTNFQFIGEGNRLNKEDKAALESAKNLEEANKTPEEIYTKTNWFKTNQGIWIREIGDLQIKPFSAEELTEEVNALYSEKEITFALDDLFDNKDIGNRYDTSSIDIVFKFENANKETIQARAVVQENQKKIIEISIKGSKDTVRQVLGGENIGDSTISRRVRSGDTVQIPIEQTLESIVNHEFQHILQVSDSTRKRGNSLYAILDFFARKNESVITALEINNYSDLAKALGDIYGKKDFIKYAETIYRNSIGERQATEVELRMFDKSTLPENFEGAFNVDTRDFTNNTAQFLVLGEKAATALDTTNESTFRIDNLRVAREMEQAEKTPQEIRVATGWEKGSDGLWRYEELDGNLKITSFEDLEKLLENKEKTTGGFVRVPLTDLLETEDFSKDYLNAVQNISVYFDKAVPIGQAYLQSMGIHINRFSAKYNEDFTQDNALDNFRGMLLHELQHYVQREEGFSEPFSEEEFKFRIEYEIDSAKEELEKIKRISEFEPSYKELIKPQEGVIKSLETKRNTPQEELDNWYWKSYGEIEARNVQTRMNMTPEQRRQTLLSQTEDVAREDQIMFQVEAYHGTPYSFDRFSTEAIGTGEGNQAFGWGLYFTDIKSIAENYANAVTGQNYFNKFLDAISKSATINGISLAKVGDVLDLSRNNNYDYDTTQDAAQKVGDDEILRLVQENKELYQQRSRNLYKVSLHQGKTPDQYTWLEWDKRPSLDTIEQFLDFVQDNMAISKEAKESIQNKKLDIFSGKTVVETGEAFYNGLAKSTLQIVGKKTDKDISLTLLKAGIDGIKYPAESISRGATSDTARGFNYVVFDENAVTVQERVQFQAVQDMMKNIGLDLSAPVYAQRPGESNADYHTRLVNEVEAYVTAPEIAEKLENLRQSNPGIWSKIVDFLKNLKEWLASQIGFQDYQGDILEMTKEQYTSALGVSILKDSYDDLFIPQTGKKIANEVMNATAVLDSQVEIIPLQTDEVQDTLFDKIDNCG